MGDAWCQPLGGRTPKTQVARSGWPRPPLGPGGPLALPSPLPAGGGAGARRPGAPPPPPRQAEAARWRRRRRRQPGGRGRSARLAASLLPREAEGTLSRAAAPRPVDSLWLGHGGTTSSVPARWESAKRLEGSTRGAQKGLRGGARGPGAPRAGGRWGRLAEGRRRFGERGDGSRFSRRGGEGEGE
ncbi:translation initiation factor IF-2-like isoform X2 [Prionailurus viverrinus]|uniref:translation initiation factor IF-2-like isoform X2 n=1 Tax=Prionailurus viverrinus TaxID=61388 RepID=UPI001FF13D55|nr:translation initiation factor IF-2-like isoform X2 [Prionailurus viverrinus]